LGKAFSSPNEPEESFKTAAFFDIPSTGKNSLSLDGTRIQAASFLFMRAQGGQLGQLASMIDEGAIRPVIDRVFPLESVQEALTYVESDRSKGKVVIDVR
jgi:NADPH:quinone reductase-like Zn-dependent oxidoreductase